MRQVRIDIPDQSSTLGCLLRNCLFEHGASFAACISPHPQDTSLRVIVQHDDPKQCIEDAFRTADVTLERMQNVVDAFEDRGSTGHSDSDASAFDVEVMED
jgi:DNA-directed RNA polymerase subunit L